MYFSADNGTDGYQVWSSNGTASGTAMVDDINGTAGSNPSSLTNLGGTLYFSACTSSTGFQVWQSNGTASSTTMDSDLNTPSGLSPANFVAASSTLYFTGTGASLWSLATSSNNAKTATVASGGPNVTAPDIVLMGIVPSSGDTSATPGKPGINHA